MTEPSLKEKILQIRGVIKGQVCNLNYFDFYEEDKPCLIYAFYVCTNENLNYLSSLGSFEGKEVLVPTASGDHVLSSILFGAKSVETFDINSISKFHFDIKENAIKQLSRSEFLRFYSKENLLDEDVYHNLKNNLKAETKEFFDEVYKTLKQTNKKMSLLAAEYMADISQKLNPYLMDDGAYKTLQQKLIDKKANISHTVCAAHEIEKKLKKKDVVILSNILSSYYGFNYKFKPLLQSIPNMLKDGGVASVNYIYNSLNFVQKHFLCKAIKRELNVEEKRIESKERRLQDIVLITNKQPSKEK